jgi:hypothetical protein
VVLQIDELNVVQAENLLREFTLEFEQFRDFIYRAGAQHSVAGLVKRGIFARRQLCGIELSAWDGVFIDLLERFAGAMDPAFVSDVIKLYLRNEELWRPSKLTQIHRVLKCFIDAHPSSDSELFIWLQQNISNYCFPSWPIDYVALGSYQEYVDMRDKEDRAREKRETEREYYKQEWQAYRKSVRSDLDQSRATKALLNAIKRGDLIAVQSLLTRGADFSAVVEEYGSLRKIADQHERSEIKNFLIENDIP